MTLDEHRAEIDKLVTQFAAKLREARGLQEAIGRILRAAGDEHEKAALPLLDHAVTKVRAAMLLYLETPPLKM